MDVDKVKQIVFYTRPWEVDFHIEFAKQLGQRYPEASVQFVSFFTAACRTARHAGFETLYFPDELSKVTGDEISDERFSQIDRDLYEGVGANFNLMLQSERFLPEDAHEAEVFGKKHLAVLDRLITEGTLSVSSMYDHFVYWLAGGLANTRKGWHFAFVGCGVPAGRTLALRTPWDPWKSGAVSEDIAESMLQECRESLNLPVEERISYMKNYPRRRKSFTERLAIQKDVQFDLKHGNYFAKIAIKPSRWLMEKVLPQWALSKLFLHPEPHYDFNDGMEIDAYKFPFVYLPLHMEPEAVILMYSPWLRDQLEVVRLAAQALPVGWKLLVKENPKMRGRRSSAFNNTLKAIPNVRLVSPSLPSMNLIRKAKSILVLAGTSGIEARLINKSAYYLGVPPFRHLLTDGDVAGTSFSIKKLHFSLDSQDEELDLDSWKGWLAGTVEGDVVPVRERVDSSEVHVRCFVQFIASCLTIGQ